MAKYDIDIEGGALGSDTIEASSWAEARELATEFAEDGDWGEDGATVCVRITAADGEQDWVTVTIPAEVPACVDRDDHDWQAPLDLVGGIAENPGCWGHGAGVITQQVCLRCGTGMRTNTWADDGVGGHCEAVTYQANWLADELESRDDEAAR